jgi:deazaflavin-dependent oxidoreductase (nitroreductase family)
MADFNTDVIKEFRSSGGHVGGPFGGMDLLLLTSKGAKTGKTITKPLAYSQDGDDFVVVASKGGAPTNPDWYYNLKSNPQVTVEVGDEKFSGTATEAKGKDRERLFDQHAAKYSVFNDYKAKTSRQLPVFVISRGD